MIEFKNVTKNFHEPILEDLNFELPDTGLVLIEGKENSGKSTLLNLIGSLYQPNSGDILIDDLNIAKMVENHLRQFRENYMSFIFQNDNLYKDMTVEENLTITGNKIKSDKIIRVLKIESILKEKVKYINKEEKRRVAIARGILKDSKVLLVDEPFIEEFTKDDKKEIMKLLKEISHNRLVIFATREAVGIREYFDIVIELRNAQIYKFEIINECKNKNETPLYVNTFDTKNYAENNLLVNPSKLRRNTTILLLTFLMILLAVNTSTISFSKLHAKTFINEHDDTIIFENLTGIDASPNFLESDIEILEKGKISKNRLELGKSLGVPINLENDGIKFQINYTDNPSYYYITKIDKPYVYDEQVLDKIDIGRRPVKANEIVAGSYLADQIIYYGIKNLNGRIYKPASYEQIVIDQEEIMLGEQSVKIVGIKKLPFEKFEKLKYKKDSRLHDYFNERIEIEGKNIYVKDDFFDLFDEIPSSIGIYCNPSPSNFSLMYYEHYSYDEFKFFDEPIELIDGRIIEHLNPNEIIASLDFLRLNFLDPGNYETKPGKIFISKHGDPYYKELTFKIIGVVDGKHSYLNMEDLGECVVKNIRTSRIQLKESDPETIKKILEKYPTDALSGITIKTAYSEQFEKIEKVMKVVSRITRLLATSLVLFALIFLLNFIERNIDKNKRELSTVKAFGIKDREIFEAYKKQNILITIVPFIYSLITYMLIKFIVNTAASYSLSFKIDLISFNFLSAIILIATALLIDVIAINRSNKKIEEISSEIIGRSKFD